MSPHAGAEEGGSPRGSEPRTAVGLFGGEVEEITKLKKHQRPQQQQQNGRMSSSPSPTGEFWRTLRSERDSPPRSEREELLGLLGLT